MSVLFPTVPIWKHQSSSLWRYRWATKEHCSTAIKWSFSRGRRSREKEAYQFVILPKCLQCSTLLVRGPFLLHHCYENCQGASLLGSVVNVARKANGQTFTLRRFPHYREEERERAPVLLFPFRQVFWCLYAQREKADCTVSISGQWWKKPASVIKSIFRCMGYRGTDRVARGITCHINAWNLIVSRLWKLGSVNMKE